MWHYEHTLICTTHPILLTGTSFLEIRNCTDHHLQVQGRGQALLSVANHRQVATDRESEQLVGFDYSCGN